MADVFQKLKICADLVACPHPSDQSHSPVDRLIAFLYLDLKAMLDAPS
jgi:hypothetical protein